MSDLSKLIDSIKERAKSVEDAVNNSAANHNSLIGRLEELRHVLSIVTEIAQVVAPTNPIVEAAVIVDEALNHPQ